MKKWLCAVAGLATLAGCATAKPDPATQATKLMAQAKVAAGGARLDKATTYYNSGTRVRDGKINGVTRSGATIEPWPSPTLRPSQG